MVGTIREILAAYTDVTIANFKRKQISEATPSGSRFVVGRIHPADMVACTVATNLGNLSCDCSGSIAPDCKCPTLGHPQLPKIGLIAGEKLSGITRVRDSPLLGALHLARQLPRRDQ
jgi:hypothetical protein